MEYIVNYNLSGYASAESERITADSEEEAIDLFLDWVIEASRQNSDMQDAERDSDSVTIRLEDGETQVYTVKSVEKVETEDLTQYDLILKFVEDDLNEDNKRHNATAYDHEYYEGSAEVLIVFERNHNALYRRLLNFCAENDMIVISTLPATLETVVRVKR